MSDQKLNQEEFARIYNQLDDEARNKIDEDFRVLGTAMVKVVEDPDTGKESYEYADPAKVKREV